MKIGAFILLVIISFPLWAGAKSDSTVKVVSVIDGNTIEVEWAASVRQRVVLSGIDCPEIEQEFGAEAKKFLEKKILNKDVVIKSQGKDKKGNLVAIVMWGDNDIRVNLLREGLAWTSEKNPHPDLEPYRLWAQQKGKGLWKNGNPTPPWVFRRQQSMVEAKSS